MRKPFIFIWMFGPFLFVMSGAAQSWERHTIDDSSRGADGVRLADCNGDGLPDIVTGWEEGGQIRLYLNPGPRKAKTKWPSVTVGTVASPEDAVFCDLNGDGLFEVISACEGNEKTIWIHSLQGQARDYLIPARWRTQALLPSQNQQRWMFCVPMQVDGKNGVDLIAGAKNQGAQLGWFQAPPQAFQANQWRWHSLYEAGWIMSILTEDMDGDGDLDILFSDRKGGTRGVYWLEYPGPESCMQPWTLHKISQSDKEFMFLTVHDLDEDGFNDVLVSTKRQDIFVYRRQGKSSPTWEEHRIAMPEFSGTAKAVQVGDINNDGKKDIVFSCEGAENKHGVMWLSYTHSVFDTQWTAHTVSGLHGTKYDLVELIDLDGDLDLDILTCEERDNLGVIWYENPTK